MRVPSTASTAAEEVPAGGEKSALSAFHEFVKSDRQRLEQKKKQMEGKAKSEKDKRLKELVRFGQDFKVGSRAMYSSQDTESNHLLSLPL